MLRLYQGWGKRGIILPFKSAASGGRRRSHLTLINTLGPQPQSQLRLLQRPIQPSLIRYILGWNVFPTDCSLTTREQGLIDVLLKPASLHHFQHHIELTRKLLAFISPRPPSKHSEQDLLCLLDDFSVNMEPSSVSTEARLAVHRGKEPTPPHHEVEYHLVLSRLLQMEKDLCGDLELVITVRHA